MAGFYRTVGGFKLSHSNSSAPFYSDLEKKKKKKELELKKATELKKQNQYLKNNTTVSPLEKENIKIFKIPKIYNI